jgi:polysaccharide export outer membrane protein
MVCVSSLVGCGASLNGVLQSAPATIEQGVGAPLDVDASGGRELASQAAVSFTSATTPGNTAYKIGPQDVLEISVFKVPELGRNVQVADNGAINVPLLGELPAAGKTAQELERDLAKKYGVKYLQSPQVSVFVKEYNSQRVTIEGAVKKPGVYPLRGKTSLLQFIALAEGLDGMSDSTVVVFRNNGGKRFAAKFDVDEIRAGNASDPVMQQGDVIVVSTSQFKTAFNNVLKVLPAAGLFVALL